jgi:SlyX protein
MNEMERRVAALEERLSFQERALEQVSDALAAARAELDRQARRLKRAEDQLRAAAPGAADFASADETPPHY